MTAHRRSIRAAAFFDVDETLITVKSMFGFLSHYWAAQGRSSAAFEEVRSRFAVMGRDGTPRAEANRAFYSLFTGESEADLLRHGREWFAAEHARGGLWNPEGLAAFQRHAAAGHLTVLVSGSFPPCLKPLARHLGADVVLCSRPEVVDDHYTGRTRCPMIGGAKGDAVKRVIDTYALDPEACFGYGDHPTDIPLLEQVGHPVVIGTDPQLLCHAREAGWAIAA